MANPMQTALNESTPRVPVQKFSRYRSVRKAASVQLQEKKPPLPINSQNSSLRQQASSELRGRAGSHSPPHSPRQPVRRVTKNPDALAALEGRNTDAFQKNNGIRSNATREPANWPGPTDQSPGRSSPKREDSSPDRPNQRGRTLRLNDSGGKKDYSDASPALQNMLSRRYSLAGGRGQSSPLKDVTTAVNPSIDAPISAVNAGDRKVTVLWGKDVVELIITPDTTARQLVVAASARLSRPNNDDLILLESFSQLGLERPIRHYEHIRDIMNSWDRDDLNALMIKSRSHDSRASGLTVSSAPKLQPEGQSVKLYYSQRPGRWDKRYITLNSNGQVTMAKREGAESTNICHLSDFDLYIPTRRQIKKLEPPRRCCLAIKSQQKSAVFLNGANFVHFFSTSDEDTGNLWYDAVQIWRSWYLVDRLDLHQLPQLQSSHTIKRRNSVQGRVVDPPLLNNLNLNEPLTRRPEITKPRPHERKVPPTSFPRGISTNSDPSTNQSLQPADDKTFAPDGLLGRSYTTRRPRATTTAQPSRMPTVRSPSRTRQPGPEAPAPLVDLTPVFQEPPQHLRKGGRGVAPEPGKFLVDTATNREALQPMIDSSGPTVFRRADVVAPVTPAGSATVPSPPVMTTTTTITNGPLLAPQRRTSVSQSHSPSHSHSRSRSQAHARLHRHQSPEHAHGHTHARDHGHAHGRPTAASGNRGGTSSSRGRSGNNDEINDDDDDDNDEDWDKPLVDILRERR